MNYLFKKSWILNLHYANYSFIFILLKKIKYKAILYHK